jgi:hypothetical protein
MEVTYKGNKDMGNKKTYGHVARLGKQEINTEFWRELFKNNYL